MTIYNNKRGKVTAVGENFVEIDSVKYDASGVRSHMRIALAKPRVGDPVEFNDNCGDIIYLRNLGRIGERYREATPWQHRSGGRYSEDPRDPDEVHDMEAMYGHDIGEGY